MECANGEEASVRQYFLIKCKSMCKSMSGSLGLDQLLVSRVILGFAFA